MELDHRSESAVQESCKSLTKDLYEDKPPEFSTTLLWYQNYFLSGALVRKRPIMERYLHYG